MKKLFILSLATLSFVACKKQNEHIILSGKITNFDGSPIQITGGTTLQQSLKVNQDGSFSDTLNVQPNYYTLFNTSGLYIPLYLQKGDNVIINIDLGKQPILVEFQGKDTLISGYLQRKTTLTRELQQGFMELFQKDTENFKKDVEEIDRRYKEFLNNSKGLPKDFVALEEKANKYLNLQLKSIYPKAHSRFSDSQIELPKEFADELAALDYDNSTDFESFPEYRQLVSESFYSKINRENPDWDMLVNHIRGLKSENIKGLLAHTFIEGLSVSNDSKTNEQLLGWIKEFVKDEDAIKRAQMRYESFEKLKPGNPSPAFELDNFAGGKTSLESFKGKLVYIDVWATWCVPCLKEIPKLQELENEYHGKDIVFVSISIDQDKQKWTNYQTANKLTGVQLHSDMSVTDNFANLYDIQSIPRFILIDKEGNIIDANAPRPSASSIKELINKHL
ncbi:MAG: TlpA disulfide reductase family protein [Capnocytophaga felis]|nr:TlpA disulfide reductase family protein [Capnocytophaga felis]